MSSGLTWNLLDDVRQVLAFHFMVNAVRAGTIVAAVAGALGYFMVLRRQTFVGHTLAIIGFPGAAAATYLGLATPLGYFGFCIAGGLVIAGLTDASDGQADLGGFSEESAVIGTVQGVALACGFLFVSLYHGFLGGLTSLLFGSIIGVTDVQVLQLLGAGAVCLLVVALVARPLLFASVDPLVAGARGLRVRLLDALFLVVLGVAAAGTSQVTGSLLVFALLVAPAATASRLTARPGLGVALSVVIALLVTWAGELVAFFSPYPIGFWVATFAFGAYLVATAVQVAGEAWGRRRIADGDPAQVWA